MTAIGFAEKYFTLWNICKKDVQCSTYVDHQTICQYIKNISMDEAKVHELYPGVEIDWNLKGHHTFIASSVKEWDNTKFLFGKYQGNKIDESTDYDYMQWYYDAGIPDESKAIIEAILTQNGYVKSGNRLITDAEYNQIKAYEAEEAEQMEQVKNGECHFESNIDYNGYYYICPKMRIKFPEVATNCYQGYEYYLPKLNGKAKRIKNKNVRFTDYIVNTVTDESCPMVEFEIVVNNFEIIK